MLPASHPGARTVLPGWPAIGAAPLPAQTVRTGFQRPLLWPFQGSPDPSGQGSAGSASRGVFGATMRMGAGARVHPVAVVRAAAQVLTDKGTGQLSPLSDERRGPQSRRSKTRDLSHHAPLFRYSSIGIWNRHPYRPVADGTFQRRNNHDLSPCHETPRRRSTEPPRSRLILSQN